MKRRMVHFFATLLALIAFTVAGSAFAGPATDMVKTKQTALFDLLRQGNQPKIDAVFDEMLDYQALAEASLGDEWAPRSDAEKAQFSGLLKQLVRNAYQRNLKKIIDYEVAYLGDEPAGDATLVKTTSKPKDPREDPVEINFRLVTDGKGWKVQDIITEGASMVGGFHRDFKKVITKDGFPTLIQKMKDKLAKGN